MPPAALNPREIVEALMAGRSERDVAASMGVSVCTLILAVGEANQGDRLRKSIAAGVRTVLEARLARMRLEAAKTLEAIVTIYQQEPNMPASRTRALEFARRTAIAILRLDLGKREREEPSSPSLFTSPSPSSSPRPFSSFLGSSSSSSTSRESSASVSPRLRRGTTPDLASAHDCEASAPPECDDREESAHDDTDLDQVKHAGGAASSSTTDHATCADARNGHADIAPRPRRGLTDDRVDCADTHNGCVVPDRVCCDDAHNGCADIAPRPRRGLTEDRLHSVFEHGRWRTLQSNGSADISSHQRRGLTEDRVHFADARAAPAAPGLARSPPHLPAS